MTVEAWLDERRSGFGLQVARATLSHCAAWRLEEGELRHVTGRFFQVVGAEAVTPAGETWQGPLLRQEEIGLLAFLVRESVSGHQWLLQAKAEPGNVGGVQIAPTIQATESNFQRVHGGAATRFIEWFLSGSDEHVVTDVLGSEIGSRFLRKRNRNALALVPAGRRVALGGAWRWFDGVELRAVLGRSYAVGTEARSVIVSGPWSLIADGRPFSRWRGGRDFRSKLARSYETEPEVAGTLAQLGRARAAAVPGAGQIPLQELGDWRLDERGLHPRGRRRASVSFVSVVAHDREVHQWCQPLMGRTGVAACDLICQEREGVLRFLLRAAWEHGLMERIELAPSRLVDDVREIERPDDETVRLSMVQSDEGGRFLHCRTRYRIIEWSAGDAEPTRPGEHWLTLAQLEALAHQPTALTNETRTALSLLLQWA